MARGKRRQAKCDAGEEKRAGVEWKEKDEKYEGRNRKDKKQI